VSGAAADIGAFEAQPVTAAATVNTGDVQRSSVRSMTITFSGPVNFAGGNTVANALAAFTLARTGPGGPTGNVTFNAATSTLTTDAQGRTVVTLRFTGALTEAANTAAGADPSLIDGLYTLTLNTAAVTGPGGQAVAPLTFNTHRLFGDIDGDRDVDLDDIFPGLQGAVFASPLTAHQAGFDFEGDGDVDLDDLFSFFVPRLFTSI